jgi:hypothetical protein
MGLREASLKRKQKKKVEGLEEEDLENGTFNSCNKLNKNESARAERRKERRRERRGEKRKGMQET